MMREVKRFASLVIKQSGKLTGMWSILELTGKKLEEKRSGF